jgi:hypothetical protein
MEPSTLPLPLNLLQAARLVEIASLRHTLTLLSSVLASNVPDVSLSAFVAYVSEFEQRYTFWNRVNPEFAWLRQFLPEHFDTLMSNGKISLQINETGVQKIREGCYFLVVNDLIKIVNIGGSMHTPEGLYFSYEIILTDRGKAIVGDEQFLK